MLYFFHKSCLIESRVRSFNNSPKCMIKIFLKSDKFSHKAGVTKHATNSLARKLFITKPDKTQPKEFHIG